MLVIYKKKSYFILNCVLRLYHYLGYYLFNKRDSVTHQKLKKNDKVGHINALISMHTCKVSYSEVWKICTFAVQALLDSNALPLQLSLNSMYVDRLCCLSCFHSNGGSNSAPLSTNGACHHISHSCMASIVTCAAASTDPDGSPPA